MHMRFKPYALPELNESGYYTNQPEAFAGKWATCFKKKQPLHLELGCGKGVSTACMVHENRNINFIAIDIADNVLGPARRNIAAQFGDEPVENVYLVHWNIDFIYKIFTPGDQIERIYINFCNPWTKLQKQAKRRLTSPYQLTQYRNFLADGGEIWFKTDSDPLFDDSIAYLKAFGFEITYLTRDLHASGFQPNYLSEHEKKFTAEGIPTKFLIARKLPGESFPNPKQWMREYALEKTEK